MQRFPVRMNWGGGGPIRRPVIHSRLGRKKIGQGESPYPDHTENHNNYTSYEVNKGVKNSDRNSPRFHANKNRRGDRDVQTREKRSGSVSWLQNFGSKCTKRGSDSRPQRRNSDSGAKERGDDVGLKGKNVGLRLNKDCFASCTPRSPRKKAADIFKEKAVNTENHSKNKIFKTRKRSPNDSEIIQPLSLGGKSRMRTITELPPIEIDPGICAGKAIGQAVLANHPNEGEEFLNLKVFDILKFYRHCLCIIETYVPDHCDKCSLCRLEGIEEDQLQVSSHFCKCGGQLWRVDIKDLTHFICSSCGLSRIYQDEHTFRYFLDYGGFVLTKNAESQPETEPSQQTQNADNPLSPEDNLIKKMANLSTKEQSWADEAEESIEEFCPSEYSASGEKQDEKTGDDPNASEQCLGKIIAENLTRTKGKRNLEFSFLPFHYYSGFIERCTCILRGITQSFCDKCYVCNSTGFPQPILVYCSCGGQLCEVDNLKYTVCSRCALHRGKERRSDFSYYSPKRNKMQIYHNRKQQATLVME
ncbi:uncharacterized protein LOC143037677 [Oratosquilla oratoria]|uniref:uncharacterized protein LOC143037677 n=1 Tax=Oratosquilla oratoria TaxID=337810 RepID=UPI003F760D17